MKTFTHPKNPRVILRRLPPHNTEDYGNYLGEEFEIVECQDCSGKTAYSSTKCRNDGDANCPGKIRLDRKPFNKSAECWSWNKSIFEFLDPYWTPNKL